MAMKGEEPKLTKLAPMWSLEETARHAVDVWLTTEDVPKPDNRVTVDRDGQVHLAYPIRRVRSSMSTAKRMRSTTCTSSTRASSRASEP